MLIDMIHDNHGEPPFKTRYRDPALLRGMGYQAIVIPDALAAIAGAPETESGPATPAMPRRPHEWEAAIDAQVSAALALDMQVFFYGDALLLPLAIIRQRPADYQCDDAGGRLCPGKPAVYQALAAQVRALFGRWPHATGLVMRTGEVYPEATPHMTGSPLSAGACPTCAPVSQAERLVRFITAMHAATAAVGKAYIHRAWQPSVAAASANIHDDPATYRDLSQRIPRGVTFSFKFTPGDFHEGGAPFNPCLIADDRPKWIEFPCEREHEGKGALPNYQGPVWRDFFAHLAASSGLGAADLRDRFSLWGWSRGGGWGGPYVQREEWIDVNVRTLAEFHRHPDADPADVATTWAGVTFNIAESSPPAPAITELLMISAPTLRRLLYVDGLPSATAAVPWLKDDLLDVEALYRAALRAADLHIAETLVADKRSALDGVDRMRRLFEIAAPDLPNKSQARDLTNTLTCYHSFANTVAHLFIGFTRCAQALRTNPRDAATARTAIEHLQAAQSHWQMHTQHHAVLPGAPTMFHEVGLWERVTTCLNELGEK